MNDVLKINYNMFSVELLFTSGSFQIYHRKFRSDKDWLDQCRIGWGNI